MKCFSHMYQFFSGVEMEPRTLDLLDMGSITQLFPCSHFYR